MLLPSRTSAARALALALLLGLALGGCTGEEKPKPVSVKPPEVGTCRVLTESALAEDSDDSPVVDCTKTHSAETFYVGSFDSKATLDDDTLAATVYKACQRRYMRFVGADESLALRTVLSWAWFRPSKAAWDKGARWYRCDVVAGGGHDGDTRAGLVPLPTTTKGVLLGRPDDTWMLCAIGPEVVDAKKVACSEQHEWRAVTTIVVAPPKTPYPGDRLVEVRSRDYCSDSVGAWMNYPLDYDYGYTWFHEAEWRTGNRRSVCWAKTAQ